jgi:hypothetical protein
MRQIRDSPQVEMLMSQRLRGRQLARVEVSLRGGQILLAALHGLRRHLAMVRQQILEVLRAENRHLGEQEFALDQRGGGVIQDSPDGDEILELAAGLFDDAVLAGEDDGHAGEVLDLGVADHQRVDVEASRRKNPGYPRQHPRLVLDKAVQHVPLRRRRGLHRRLVDYAADGGGRGPDWRVGSGQRLHSSVQRFVGQRGGGAAAAAGERRGAGHERAEGARGGHWVVGGCGGGREGMERAGEVR